MRRRCRSSLQQFEGLEQRGQLDGYLDCIIVRCAGKTLRRQQEQNYTQESTNQKSSRNRSQGSCVKKNIISGVDHADVLQEDWKLEKLGTGIDRRREETARNAG